MKVKETKSRWNFYEMMSPLPKFYCLLLVDILIDTRTMKHRFCFWTYNFTSVAVCVRWDYVLYTYTTTARARVCVRRHNFTGALLFTVILAVHNFWTSGAFCIAPPPPHTHHSWHIDLTLRKLQSISIQVSDQIDPLRYSFEYVIALFDKQLMYKCQLRSCSRSTHLRRTESRVQTPR